MMRLVRCVFACFAASRGEQKCKDGIGRGGLRTLDSRLLRLSRQAGRSHLPSESNTPETMHAPYHVDQAGSPIFIPPLPDI